MLLTVTCYMYFTYKILAFTNSAFSPNDWQKDLFFREPSVKFGVFTGEKQAELSKNGGNLLKESGINRTLALHMV